MVGGRGAALVSIRSYSFIYPLQVDFKKGSFSRVTGTRKLPRSIEGLEDFRLFNLGIRTRYGVTGTWRTTFELHRQKNPNHPEDLYFTTLSRHVFFMNFKSVNTFSIFFEF